jgi:hypothetical protein
VQVLQRFRDAVRRKRLGKWQAGTAVSASRWRIKSHIAYCAVIPVITKPPCSPDLAPSGFWLFSALSVGLKGTCFGAIEDIQANAAAELRKIPKEAFRRCSQQSSCMSHHYCAMLSFRELFDWPPQTKRLHLFRHLKTKLPLCLRTAVRRNRAHM